MYTCSTCTGVSCPCMRWLHLQITIHVTGQSNMKQHKTKQLIVSSSTGFPHIVTGSLRHKRFTYPRISHVSATFRHPSFIVIIFNSSSPIRRSPWFSTADLNHFETYSFIPFTQITYHHHVQRIRGNLAENAGNVRHSPTYPLTNQLLVRQRHNLT